MLLTQQAQHMVNYAAFNASRHAKIATCIQQQPV
jgi:hypothetical protein